ncbi:hypothetical protein BH09ACT7_BH09ACT7_28780 [soil metagenome]
MPPPEVSSLRKDRLGRLRPARRRRNAFRARSAAVHLRQRFDCRTSAEPHPTMVAPMTEDVTHPFIDDARR